MKTILLSPSLILSLSCAANYVDSIQAAHLQDEMLSLAPVIYEYQQKIEQSNNSDSIKSYALFIDDLTTNLIHKTISVYHINPNYDVEYLLLTLTAASFAPIDIGVYSSYQYQADQLEAEHANEQRPAYYYYLCEINRFAWKIYKAKKIEKVKKHNQDMLEEYTALKSVL